MIYGLIAGGNRRYSNKNEPFWQIAPEKVSGYSHKYEQF
jgi:hypothetical protein